MMHQVSRSRLDSFGDLRAADTRSIGALAYRSRAVSVPTPTDLDKILRAAQERNHREGLTGLLIYDKGFFFQWLEGPRLGLTRVWDSIRRDTRHCDFKVLRQHHSIPKRFFKGWDMRLARRARGDVDRVMTVMQAPEELLGALRIQPSALSDGGWDGLFANLVIPHLHPVRAVAPAARSSSPAIWHAQREAGAQLAGILLAVNSGETAQYIDGLIEQGARLETLYHEVFEPAARCLGGLWEEDLCDDFGVALAMGRLQLEAHRLSSTFSAPAYMPRPGHAILVAPQPGEPHGLNATLCSELFYRHGWEVSSEFPKDDDVLREMLHDQWFDVLDLSLSGALRRDQQLAAMRITISAARAASRNPALTVIVDGRSFLERPRACLEVGADVACLTSTDAVMIAERLLSAVLAAGVLPDRVPQVSVG